MTLGPRPAAWTGKNPGTLLGLAGMWRPPQGNQNGGRPADPYRAEHGVGGGQALQADGELDIAAAHHVLDLELLWG